MKTGIFDRTRLFANVLMVVLVGMNIFFSIQYTQGMKRDDAKLAEETLKTEERIKVSKFMKLFIDKVLGTSGEISFEDRVKLESDIRSLNDKNLVDQWELFVNSKDSAGAQKNAVLLMSILMSKMII